MSSALAGLVDAYALRARVFPATLALLPLTVVVLLAFPSNDLAKVWPVAASAGVIFFLSQWVRARGLKLEARLLQRWGGWPTTEMLRPTDGPHHAVVQRRRIRLEQVTGLPLPSAEPAVDAAIADAVYHQATRALITKTRGKPGAERVQEENVSYGFRRNLLALKPLAILSTGAALAVDVVWLLPDRPVAGSVCAAACALAVGVWMRVITPEFVHQQARSYAERLFETLEDERLTSNDLRS